MGLFSSSPDDEVAELVENANHSSVTESRLTELDSTGLTGRKGSKLYDKPLIEYLNNNEQPNYIFYPANKSTQITHNRSGSVFNIEGNDIYCITDERVLVVAGRKAGDTSFSIPLSSIDDFECEDGGMKHRISIIVDMKNINKNTQIILEEEANTPEGMCKIDLYIVNAFDSEDINEANKYLRSAIKPGDSISIEEDGSELEYYEKISDHLDEDEIPQYILRGKTLETEYGDSDDKKSGKSVYTAVTNKRVLIVVVQRVSGNDTRNIQYSSIDGINFEKGIMTKKLQIRAGGATYKLHVLDQADTKEAMEYMREQTKTSKQPNQPASSESSPDPTEQLKNLKELHNKGVISDKEFESKKEDLMDRI